MKRTTTLAILLVAALQGSAQSPIYFDFVTHNEETGQWNGTPFYLMNRARCITIADHFQAIGATWNMQSDWVYLTNVITKETPSVTLNTANKNIQRWLHEDRGVEMDPHAHESQYFYPDVAALMDSIGLPESKVMGGSIYNDYNGQNLWMDLVDGQYGTIFTNYFWQPDYIMGGGTPNHVDDLNYFGFWNPQDTANYLVHDPSSHLRHIGTGCSIKIQDTSTVAYVMSQVNDLITRVQSVSYPANCLYFQTIFFEQAELNSPAFLQMVMDVADSVDALVESGAADWRTFSQAYTEWETNCGAEIFQWECGAVYTGVEERTWPVPLAMVFHDHIAVNGASPTARYSLFNVCGKAIWSGTRIQDEDLSDLASGLYVLHISDGGADRAHRIFKE